MTLALALFMLAVWVIQPDWALHCANPEATALVTAQFYHKDLTHLVANLLVFAIVGYDFERTSRSLLALPLFVLGSGLLATVIEVLLTQGFTGQLYGASGFVASLVGVFVRSRKHLLIASPVIISILWSAFVDHEKGMAHGAHVGGLLIGLACALIVTASRKTTHEEPTTGEAPAPAR
jgi:membrane associated rhomboid family serine protease